MGIATGELDQFVQPHEVSDDEARSLLDAAFGGPFVEAVADVWRTLFRMKDDIDYPTLTEIQSALVASGSWFAWMEAWLYRKPELTQARLARFREMMNFDEWQLELICERADTEGVSKEEIEGFTVEMHKDLIDKEWRDFIESGSFGSEFFQDEPHVQFGQCEFASDGEVMPEHRVRRALDDLELPYIHRGQLINDIWRHFPAPQDEEASRRYVSITALRSRGAAAAPARPALGQG